MGDTGRRRARTGGRVALAVGLVLALVGCARASGPAEGDDGPSSSTVSTDRAGRGEVPAGRDVTVTSITDGDTFRAGDERVRLIGIDTPEVAGDEECFGREASAALERLIPPGTEVRLVADVEPQDRYGRTLAYVYRASDGEHVNLALARDGYALPLTVPPNVAHEAAFAQAAAEARERGRGLWSSCPEQAPATEEAPATSTTPATPVPPATGGATGSGGACDPAYPDVCIPPAPPDLDCADVPHRGFRVLPPDPHRFDGGGDGIGCEAA